MHERLTDFSLAEPASATLREASLSNAMVLTPRPPGARVISNRKPVKVLKFDLRDYTYDGHVQRVAARFYQGQTTNLRTLGGGFAPVYEGPADGYAGRPSEACTPAPHESCLFLLDQGEVQPLAPDRYVALARGEVAATEFADRRFVLVDRYMRMACGQPAAIVNETRSRLVFDAQGAIDPHAAGAIDAVAAPTDAQWAELRTRVFGPVRVRRGTEITP